MPMSSPESKATLTEQHVIIIACVCGVIIITLLIILFCFIFRRKRNAAKHPHPQQNQGDPPPYTSVATSKTPAVYDNQGMDPSDLQQLTPSRVDPSAPPEGSRGPRPGSSPRGPHQPGPSRGMSQGPPMHAGAQSPSSVVTNPSNYNNRMEAYSNRDAVQRSPAPDQYIELQDRGGGGDPNSSAEGGFNPHNPHGDGGRGVGGGKPKKVIYEVVV